MADQTDSGAPVGRFRRTLIQVLAVQAVVILALWLVQLRYGR